MTAGTYDLFGLAIGEGTPFEVFRFEGIDGAPIESQIAPLAYDDGGVAVAAQLAGSRDGDVELELECVAETVEDAHAQARALATAMQPRATEGVLSWQLTGEPERRRLNARPASSGSRPLVLSWDASLRVFRALVRVEAADPVIYADVEQQVALAPYAGTAFADYPASQDYPKVYGAGGTGGGTVVTNGGNYPVWPRFEIVGPPAGSITPLTLENVTTGGVVAFDGLSVGVGQTLIVETHPARRVVDFTSGASRLSTVRDLDSWFRLDPGDNELRFRAGGTTEGASASVTWRDGFL